MVSLERFNRSYNTVEYIFGRIYVRNKMNVNLRVFNLKKRINESKTLINLFHVNAGVN